MKLAEKRALQILYDKLAEQYLGPGRAVWDLRKRTHEEAEKLHDKIMRELNSTPAFTEK